MHMDPMFLFSKAVLGAHAILYVSSKPLYLFFLFVAAHITAQRAIATNRLKLGAAFCGLPKPSRTEGQMNYNFELCLSFCFIQTFM